MDLLARREHARAELITKLAKRGHAAADIEAVLDELAGQGLQSDARYAEAAVANKSRRGIGPVRIAAELRSAGVDAVVIDAALAEAEIDWNALAEAARRKRFGDDPPDDFPTKAKQMRFLQRRGFDADQLAAAFDE
ncbi:regulatory protein RecX [Salinisphaera sp.]|uniref:regulatory protein RecX n=1 Tax=Salinisphaera sp. TaxID=1914330 RepID=UPI002D77AD96|nr:regulatory protein RecX [Salinisphaera sp.]HET7313056.1 regulatory protein RecX [Salinisphaera sp.]